MANEAAINAAARAAFVERMLGDPQRFDVNAERGCPKCGRPSNTFVTTYCFGKQALDPNAPRMCPVVGEHLHKFCTCGHGWLEKCKDA